MNRNRTLQALIRRNTLKIAAVLLCSIILISPLTTVALAYSNPHEGTFTSTTASCAGCHRTHTASAPSLLGDSSQYNLCTSCHDGTGADTKVTTGIYLGTTEGTLNTGLRGGGFVQALMNTSVNSSFNATGTPVAVTSKHDAGSSSITAWGSGSISSGSGETVGLECGNCHNPHGNASYRLLRPRPTSLAGWSGLTPVTVTDEASTNYTITYDADYYRDLNAYESGTTSSIGAWCSQCHTRYLASFGSASTPSGDNIFAYRHMTIGVFPGGCLKCHVAHGTVAVMQGYASTVAWPDDTPSNVNMNSRLLHVDGRGVCTLCHLDAQGNVVWYNHAGTPYEPDDDYCASCHRARI